MGKTYRGEKRQEHRDRHREERQRRRERREAKSAITKQDRPRKAA